MANKTKQNKLRKKRRELFSIRLNNYIKTFCCLFFLEINFLIVRFCQLVPETTFLLVMNFLKLKVLSSNILFFFFAVVKPFGWTSAFIPPP